ncbi:c-type cytochrome biogenesis protein CcsB [bacterium]|nr:c-type cytochrome biogenesis protein CcsB [bacterium]
MSSDKLIGLSMIIYLVSFLLHMVALVTHRPDLKRQIHFMTSGVVWLGLLVHTSAFGLRWLESYQLGYGRIPLTNMYESMVFFAWTIIVLLLVLKLRYGHHFIGIVATPLAAITLGLTSIFNIPTQIDPLIPALQSNWLTAHVITCFLGYGAFAISFGVSLLFLYSQACANRRITLTFLPKAAILDELNYKAIAVGFPMLTLGIFTGAVWAEYAWGTYWSWDPKETWSLITWFVYALFLHLRLQRGWKGTRSAILALIGFAVVIFTYFGVNYLLVGLHSYA